MLSVFSCDDKQDHNIVSTVSDDFQKRGLKISQQLGSDKFKVFVSASPNLATSNINLEIYNPIKPDTAYPVDDMVSISAYQFLKDLPVDRFSNLDFITVTVFRNGTKYSKSYSIKEMIKIEGYMDIIRGLAVKIQTNELTSLQDYFVPELSEDVDMFKRNIARIDSSIGGNTESSIVRFDFTYNNAAKDSIVELDFVVANKKYQTRYATFIRKADKKLIWAAIN